MPLASRIVPLVSIVLLSSVAAAQTAAPLQVAKNSSAFCDLNRAFANSDTVVTTGASSRVTLGLRMLNKVDEDLVNQFRKAWAISKAGCDSREGLVMVFLMRGGRYMGRLVGATNEFAEVTFKWDPASIALVHTHPNGINARPSSIDELAAEKLGIPIFTITNRGMYVYNPTTMRTTRVMNDLDWLEPSKWAIRVQKHPTLLDEYSDLSY